MSQPEINNIEEVQQNETVKPFVNEPSQYEVLLQKNVEKINALESELKKKNNELAENKEQMAKMEKEVAEAQKFKSQHQKDTEEVELIKIKSEDTLTRAKSIIFDKTKVIKNQELQIEALNQQIEGMRDVVQITKDLLEIRNMEVKQLEIKIKCMEDRVKAEKERQDLMHQKLEQMIRHNGELKREYETQLCLFSALRERYNERELARNILHERKESAREGTSKENEDLPNGETDKTEEQKPN